jgi:cardiolipin synthase (CMP-forming)
LISKINTAAQFVLVTLVLGLHGYSIANTVIIEMVVYVVAVTTLMSGAAYVGIWGMRATNAESGD